MEKDLQCTLPDRDGEIWKEVLKDCFPLSAGIIPFGLTCGILGRASGMSIFETTFMSLTVFAGAAQFVAIALIGSGNVGWAAIILTTFMINLRHLLMGASLSPYLLKLPRPLQYILAFLLVDESYALTMNRIESKGYDLKYHIGVCSFLYVIWNLSTFLGAFFCGIIPDPLEWGIDFVLPATFMVLLAPRLADRTGVLVCLVSALLSVLGALYLPGKWYIIIAAVAATLAGGFIEGRRKK